MKFGYLSIIVLFLSACSVEPQEIIYGQDACEFCKMNIVDQQHAAQMVTAKGKATKYDAIECMMNYLNRNDLNSDDMAFLLITDYNNPGKLIDAKSATYIRTESIPSPMGAFLSGMEDKEIAEKLIQEKGGSVFDWTELKERYKAK